MNKNESISNEDKQPEATTDTLSPEETSADAAQDPTPGTAEQQQEDAGVDQNAAPEEPVDPMQVLQQEVSHLKDTLLRKTAEFENIKKRMLRERMELLEGAKVEALRKFLPVSDDLQRTLQAAEGQDIPASFLEGVSMVADKFSGILSEAGVVPILETGVPFDVNIHDALMRQPAPDADTPSDTVLQILEPGYKAGDKVIRHAKVIVSE